MNFSGNRKAIPYPAATARLGLGAAAAVAVPTPPARPVAGPPPVYRPSTAPPMQRAAARALPHVPAVYRPANCVLVQTKPAAARQLPPPVYRPATPTVRPANSIQPFAAHAARPIVAPALVALRSQPLTIQMRHSDGFYVANTKANLRAKSDEKYKVTQELPKGTLVYAKDNQETSKFKAGWFTNEHTWVEVIDAVSEEGGSAPAQGWVNDSNLSAKANILQTNFRPGDKLYGRHEARNTIRRSAEPYNAGIIRADHNIIDDINDRIMNKEDVSKDEEASKFSQFASGNITKGKGFTAGQLCKRALAHYTIGGHTIHFMLDGLDSDDFTPGFEEHEDEEKRESITNSELRSLMRQRLYDMGTSYGKNYGVVLSRVLFYQNYQQVPAPWENGADPAWHLAWISYAGYRQQKKQKQKSKK